MVIRADVSDRQAMREVVHTTVERWGAINGVFHTAGVAGGGLIQLKDLSVATGVLSPKVRGTLVLEEVLAGQDVDFLVLFGSNGANIGSAGQVDYCAANCFLDAFAQDRGRRRRVVSVDWGSWKGIGMAVNTALPAAMEQARNRDVDLRGMSADEGLRALDTILTSASEPQVVVSPVELSELFARAFTLDYGRSVEQRSAHHARPDMVTEYAAPRGTAERVICEVWQDMLGIERVGVQDSFFDLGGDSLVAIQLMSAVNARLGSTLTVGDLYEGPTAGHLAALVEPTRTTPGNATRALGDRKENLRKRRQHQQRRRAAREQ
jgi:NAD(P)-dependent dehydrogenase (short-subunit alcohol dehydrogenase family)/acyl carrier protein